MKKVGDWKRKTSLITPATPLAEALPRSQALTLRELPSCRTGIELLFVHSQRERWTNPKNGPYRRIKLPGLVFSVVGLGELADEFLIAHLFRLTMHYDRLMCTFIANNAVRISGEISSLATLSVGAEIKRTTDPDTPDRHRVRAPIRIRCD